MNALEMIERCARYGEGVNVSSMPPPTPEEEAWLLERDRVQERLPEPPHGES